MNLNTALLSRNHFVHSAVVDDDDDDDDDVDDDDDDEDDVLEFSFVSLLVFVACSVHFSSGRGLNLTPGEIHKCSTH